MAKKAAKKKSAKSAPGAKADGAEQPPLEEALARLHEIVAALESGETSLEESLERYEEGMTLLRGCHARLTDAEQRIAKLAGFDADGQPQTEPFDGAAPADTVDGAGRRESLFDA